MFAARPGESKPPSPAQLGAKASAAAAAEGLQASQVREFVNKHAKYGILTII
jgi:hypothetical protein